MSGQMPLGSLVGARSGDKGGVANLGVWVRDPSEEAAVRICGLTVGEAQPTAEEIARADAQYRWLVDFLTVEGLKLLLPETGPLRVERFELPNLRALNFLIHGLLGRGVAETSRPDPQAKGLGEHLRARLVEVPAELLEVR